MVRKRFLTILGAVCVCFGVCFGAQDKEWLLGQLAVFTPRTAGSEEIQSLADACRQLEEFGAGKELYAYIADNRAEYENRMWSCAGLAMCEAALKDNAGAAVTVERLLSEFEGHSELARAVEDVAGYYVRFGNAREGRRLYEWIMSNRPKEEYTLWVVAGLARANIALWDYRGADGATDRLIRDYASDGQIRKAVEDIASLYLRDSRWEKAQQLYCWLMDNRSAEEHTIWTYAGLAVSSAAVGDEARAQGAIGKLKTEFNGRDLVQIFTDIGHSYRERGEYEQARQHYGYAVNGWADDGRVVWAEMGLGLVGVATGDDAAADASVAELINRYGTNKFAAHATYSIAAEYDKKGEYAKAKSIYDLIAGSWPEDEFAAKARADSVRCWALAGEGARGEVQVESMVAQLAQDPAGAGILYDMAGNCERAGDGVKALELYQAVVEHWPDDEEAMRAYVKLAAAEIAKGNDEAAESIVRLLASKEEFANYPELPLSIFEIGEEYYNKAFDLAKAQNIAQYEAYLTKAKNVWLRILLELDEAKYENDLIWTHARYFCGVCCRRTGEFQKALEYNEAILKDHPEYEYAWSAQFLIASCYDGLKETGEVAPAIADVKAEEALVKVVEKYPRCGSYKTAVDRLILLNSRKRDWLDLAYYSELFLSLYPGDRKERYVTYQAARGYEGLGESSVAIAVYRSYLDKGGERVQQALAAISKLEEAAQ